MNSSSMQNLSDVLEQHPFTDFVLPPRAPIFSISDSEKQAIMQALAATRGERAKAAHLLQIGRTTLYRKMKEYGID
jgi:transcriptional regulator of acetoin/glycerol metabolism